MKLGVTLPSRTGPIAGIYDLARRAESAGLDSVWAFEVFRNPMIQITGAALTTDRIALGTGIEAALSRSPFDVANQAVDVDELSGGRFTLGLGTGDPTALRAFHNSHGKVPVPRLREYMDVVRRTWAYLADEQVEPLVGEHYSFTPGPVNPWGSREPLRTDIPIYLAAIGPRMLQLCGEQAQGWLGYFATPELLEQYVRPNLEIGARRTGRDASEIELTIEMVCAISPDRELAYARARRQVGFYAVHPITDTIAAGYGLLDAVNELRLRFRTDGVDAFAHTDDRLVDLLSITGTPEEARQKLDAYGQHVDHIALHTPYVPPLTLEDCHDNFTNILETFSRRPATT